MAGSVNCAEWRAHGHVLCRHPTRERATLADLAHVLSRVGEDGGMTGGVAKLIFEKREEIERVFAGHEAAEVVPIKGAS